MQLNFYGTTFFISSEDLSVLDKLRKDFSHFVVDKKDQFSHFTINISLNSAINFHLPEMVAIKQSPNSITYQQGSLRYNDYYGKVLSVFHQQNNYIEIFGIEINKIHEVTYLLILSLCGKSHDKKSLHRLHASAVEYLNQNYIFAMPMKGGKTTLFMELLKNSSVKIVSDDTPLVSSKGDIWNFPIRVGVENLDSLYPLDHQKIYSIDREHYGKKILIPTNAFKNQIADNSFKKNNLYIGRRTSHKDCTIKQISKIKAFFSLQEHMMIGIGLPIILEYFLNFNFKDFYELPYIYTKRVLAAIKLVAKSNCYEILLTNSIAENLTVIKKHIQI